jgi:phosphoribosylaminoimidazole-succinocarboxamide synthase
MQKGGGAEGRREVFETSIKSLPLLGRGKVRDIYAVGDDKLLIVTTDRLSAYDVILPTPVPEKGRVLNQLANFWFARLAAIVPNHLTGIDPESVVAPDEREQVRGRSMVVKRLEPLPIEAVVRGYLEGSGWKEYSETGKVCGIPLPPGLKRASKLPHPIFTPATKAEAGHHDENITFEQMAKSVGEARAREVRETAIKLYNAAGGLRARARDHHRRHQVRVRRGRRREAAPHRRGAHARFLALLAARHLPRRRKPAELRQAVRAQLARTRSGSRGKPPPPPCPRTSRARRRRNTRKH